MQRSYNTLDVNVKVKGGVGGQEGISLKYVSREALLFFLREVPIQEET